MNIESISFEGSTYPVKLKRNADDDLVMYEFHILVNGTSYRAGTQLTDTLVNDMQSICGLDVEEELKNVLVYELKADLFKILYNETVIEQLDKAFGLVGKTNDDLQALADKDETFAVYLRNFNMDF